MSGKQKAGSHKGDKHAGRSQVIAETALPLDPTGVPSLDLVLGGGLLRGSLTILVGPPGCGKTTLACQLAFAAARAGRRVLILTAFSEPTSKLLAHLSVYSFFDPDLIGGPVRMLSVGQFLAHGLGAAAGEVVALAREGDASLVVLDGFSGVRAADPDPIAARQFLFDVGTALSLQGATTIITTEAEVRDPAAFPEATTADTILGLYFSVQDERQRRRLEVVKARGTGPLSGLHGLAISSAGIVISPRLEARVMRADSESDPTSASGPAEPRDAAGRVTFALPALDALLDGGLTRATTTVLLGSGGTGKTLLALQFALAGVRAGEPVVFLGFHEDQRQLQLKADTFDLGPELRAALAPGGGLTLLHRPPIELEADALADSLLASLDRTGARRLVVDSIAEVERAVSEGSGPRRVQNYLSALVVALRARRITAVLTRETGPLAGMELRLETDLSSAVAENVLWLQGVIYRERFYRVLSVLKMRFSPHDLTLREFTIGAPAGIEVRAQRESERGVLAGIASQQSDTWPSTFATSTIGGPARARRGRSRPARAEQPSRDGT
ncbi:MAG TPA: ATPase domain-containing protein [Chloroflexota bacterium]|nr:ATPase domain-containing protein [Chloroflexota bacterium]